MDFVNKVCMSSHHAKAWINIDMVNSLVLNRSINDADTTDCGGAESLMSETTATLLKRATLCKTSVASFILLLTRNQRIDSGTNLQNE